MIYVIKADRTREPFSEDKVIQSIRRAKIPANIQNQTLKHIQSKLYDGISTSEIYQHILEFLDQSERPYIKSRYSLKESIMMLGPSGYPFEDFVAKILTSFGYTTKVRQILSGKCISHEIDIIAEKDNKSIMIEAKFHNNPGTRSEVHVALYTYARYQDVQMRNNVDEAWIVTNTKMTIDAINFAACSGMNVMSWGYPEGKSLRDLIEASRLHPITILTTLSQSSKVKLLENHTVLCKDIYENNAVLDILPLSKEERERILTEVDTICRQEEISLQR